MTKTGILLCGHGSRSTSAVAEFTDLAALVPHHLPQDWVCTHGFLEFAAPVIRDGLDFLRAQGCTTILAVPIMLFAAGHSKNDIPSVLNTYAAQHGCTIRYGRELGIDQAMLTAAAARIRTAIDNANAKTGNVDVYDTCLVVIGRGASDPDANSHVARIGRLLWEGFGFGWCSVGYSGVTFPLVEPCLKHVLRLGYKRIIVFPYFLFSGILIDRIYGFTDHIARAHPNVDIVKAGYLGAHTGVVDTVCNRFMELFDPAERLPDNCAMCKYRTAILGFEADVGLPQHSHHHHVEGQGAQAPGSNVQACALCDDFCTGACRLDTGAGVGTDTTHHHHHHHHHHHPIYPHAQHPLGPESVRTYSPAVQHKDKIQS